MFMANYSIALHTISKIQNSAKREIAKNTRYKIVHVIQLYLYHSVIETVHIIEQN